MDCPADPSVLCIYLKRYKIDPLHRGMDVLLGKTNNALCPVGAMLANLAVQGGDGEALFRFKDGQPLTRSRVFCGLRTGSSIRGKSGGKQVRRPQLLQQSRDDSGAVRCNRRDYHAVEKVAKLCLPSVCANPQESTGSTIADLSIVTYYQPNMHIK